MLKDVDRIFTKDLAKRCFVVRDQTIKKGRKERKRKGEKPFATLFANATFEILRYERPTFRAIFLDELFQMFVLLFLFSFVSYQIRIKDGLAQWEMGGRGEEELGSGTPLHISSSYLRDEKDYK